MSAAEILTAAVLAAKYFQKHYEHAIGILVQLGYIKPVSLSRFRRRLHALRDWLVGILGLLGEIFTQGTVFIIDSMPLPVCKRARARRCRQVRGRFVAIVPPKMRSSSAGAYT